MEQSNKGCKVAGCLKEFYAKGYCASHYNQAKRRSEPILRTRNERNEIVDCGDYCEIVLYDRNLNEKARAKIDKEVVESIKECKWYLANTGYVMSDTKIKASLLHRYLTKAEKGYVVDHINHDKLDNRKSNLRVCTQSENLNNLIKKVRSISGYMGVTKHKKWWTAQISVNGKRVYLGIYKHLEEAVEARKQAERQYLGEYIPRYE